MPNDTIPLPEPFSDMQYCRPSGVFGRLEGYTADQMHAHAAAVSAAKNARIKVLEDALRAICSEPLLPHNR